MHSCKPREDEEEACSKRGIGGRSALAVRTFPRCSYSLHSARRRGCGGVTAAAAAVVSQQWQTLHCRSSLPSREPQSDYSAPLRTQEPARFKPPKIAIAAAAAAAAAAASCMYVRSVWRPFVKPCSTHCQTLPQI